MNTERTSLFLMANLASEGSRVLSSRSAGDRLFEQESLERADRIISDVEKLPEMSKRKEEVALISEAIREPSIAPEHIRSYFDPFLSRLFASQG